MNKLIRTSGTMSHKVVNNLKYYREKLGVTGKQIEWRVPVSNGQWPVYEAGREPKVTLAQRIVEVYNEIAQEKGINIVLGINDLWPPGQFTPITRHRDLKQ
jgi:predicted transcriptional regulator